MHLQKEDVEGKNTNESEDKHQYQVYDKKKKYKFPHEVWDKLRTKLGCQDVSKMP